MSKRQIIMLLALWIILLPFLGFKSTWDKNILIITGLIILILSMRLNQANNRLGKSSDKNAPEKAEQGHDGIRTDVGSNVPYVEHKSQPDGQEWETKL